MKLLEVIIIFKKQCPYLSPGLLKNAPLSTLSSYLPTIPEKQAGQVKP